MDKTHREELHALHGELGGRAATPGRREGLPPRSRTEQTELERTLEELHRALTSAAAEAEEMVAEHPMASLAAAFCVGMIVGRLSGAFR